MKTTAEKISVMQAYEDGWKILAKHQDGPGLELIKVKDGELAWNWFNTDYSIVEEPKRIPFDWLDSFNLLGRKFKYISYEFHFALAVSVDKGGVYLAKNSHEIELVSYEELSKDFEIWNDTLKVWQPCNKVS